MRTRTAQLPPALPGAPWGAHPASGELHGAPRPAKDGCSDFPAGSTGEDGAGRGALGPLEMGPQGLLGAQFPCSAGGGGAALGAAGLPPLPELPPLPGLVLLRGYRCGRLCQAAGATDTAGTTGAAPAAAATGTDPAAEAAGVTRAAPASGGACGAGEEGAGRGRRLPEDASLSLWI